MDSLGVNSRVYQIVDKLGVVLSDPFGGSHRNGVDDITGNLAPVHYEDIGVVLLQESVLDLDASVSSTAGKPPVSHEFRWFAFVEDLANVGGGTIDVFPAVRKLQQIL